MTTQRQQWEKRWHAIEQAGGRYQYIQQQLKEKGFLVERRPIDNMTASERDRYKKQLKEEAEHKRTLAKEAWQAYKANHIVYLGQGIYWTDDTSEDKWDVPDRAKRLIENQLPIINTVNQLADSLNLTLPQLKGLSFHREVATNLAYRHFSIAKRSGGERHIFAPLPRLKYAQRWILDNILNNLPIHGAAHGFVIGKSIASNAHIHVDSQLLIKFDIKDFFPSVNWRRVKGVFRHAGYSEQIATLLAMLCTEAPRQLIQHHHANLYVALGERCLPQGSPASPAITNIICVNLDRRLTGLAEKLGLRYSRYADDLTFSLPKTATVTPDAQSQSALIKQLIGNVANILREEGFAIHPDKTRVIRPNNRQQVTGMVINGNGMPRVAKDIKRSVRAMIYNLQRGKSLKDGETLQQLQGYIAWIAMTEPQLAKKFAQQLAGVTLKNNP